MKVLLLPCHEVLERDELVLLRELGHTVFSPGSFVSPENRGDQCLRPTIPDLQNDPDDVAMFHTLASPGVDNKSRLTVEFVKRFDCVIVHHIPDWISEQWGVFREAGKPVVWRTIGQSIDRQERQLAPMRREGLRIVRYSPTEARIPDYIGADAMIRFYKDPDEFAGWTGTSARVLHLAQDPIKRGDACSWDFYEHMTRPFPRTLLGNGTEAVPWGLGRVSFDVVKEALREHRAFFFTGTHPASYTLGFIEALMTGTPVVSVGNIHGNSKHIINHKLFEVPEILDGNNGLASDDPFEISDYIEQLLEINSVFAAGVSARGRETAIRLFGKEVAASGWAEFLRGVA